LSIIGYFILHKAGILRTDLRTEIVGYDFIEFADDYELQYTTLKPREKVVEKKEGGAYQAAPTSPTQ